MVSPGETPGLPGTRFRSLNGVECSTPELCVLEPCVPSSVVVLRAIENTPTSGFEPEPLDMYLEIDESILWMSSVLPLNHVCYGFAVCTH